MPTTCDFLSEAYGVHHSLLLNPVCGEDFCDGCGDCLDCYIGDPCIYYGEHSWVFYWEDWGPPDKKVETMIWVEERRPRGGPEMSEKHPTPWRVICGSKNTSIIDSDNTLVLTNGERAVFERIVAAVNSDEGFTGAHVPEGEKPNYGQDR